MDEEMKPTLPRKPRGFATMSKEAVRELARKGGLAAHLPGAGGHTFTSEEAREAGRKGGLAYAAKKRAEKARVAALAQVRGLGG